MRFSAITPGLFDRVVNRCVVAGTECIADIMKKDRALDRDNGGMFAPHAMDHAAMNMNESMPSMSGETASSTPAAHDHTNAGTNIGAPAAPEQQGSNARP
jgi:cytochrome o ubiquinol oxidase subunit 2